MVIIETLVGQIRANAGALARFSPPKKVGCTLSVHMGWCNHSCAPNAKIEIDAFGQVVCRALKDKGRLEGVGLKTGEEVMISYVDVGAKGADRRATLKEHYQFDCRCTRCALEVREELKAKIAAGGGKK